MDLESWGGGWFFWLPVDPKPSECGLAGQAGISDQDSPSSALETVVFFVSHPCSQASPQLLQDTTEQIGMAIMTTLQAATQNHRSELEGKKNREKQSKEAPTPTSCDSPAC